MLLASAVPENVGLLLLMVPVGPVRVGAEGAVESRIKLRIGDATDTLPAVSVAFAANEYVPSANEVDGVYVQAPEAFAVAVPI